ncbi:FAD-binding protein [Nitrincola sp. A-D6]|uniref:DASH family cryptochrome n=1 Tax=Nitrincola sp. A-D6 TaxID=1545442 RepID=UPI00051FA8BE|nr:DASH family cryptochrome [Nitrincola sp. A-D6]KGK41341.1 FAD-binding protein [Nitrincola sp. A-D6]
MLATHLYWLTQDLRLVDNLALHHAAVNCDRLIIVYALSPNEFAANRYSLNGMSDNRWRFLYQGLSNLQVQLASLGQQLILRFEQPVSALSKFIQEYKVTQVVASEQVGWYERQDWKTLQQQFPAVSFNLFNTHRLFELDQLPFDLEHLPENFSAFRKQVAHLKIDQPLAPITALPPCPAIQAAWPNNLPTVISKTSEFQGGEAAAQQQLNEYFHSQWPGQYKVYRNALDGWQHSTKFSAWLAQGSLSAKRIIQQLRSYESQHGANESTYWIYFELLWREYFQLYALKHGRALFHYRGIQTRNPLTSFYPQRFRAWCEGNTPFPLVNACMKQLNTTGFMSNRGRQIAASCLVNELQLDWRYGAAYFEQQLIDYDVASNWGNWQYLAGVGADPRGKRHFNLQKQTAEYDPEGIFIERWQGASKSEYLDVVDAADWPIMRH